MAKSSGPIVGLDIGAAFIKVVEVASHGGRPELTAVGVMPTPNDAVIQGLVIDPPALGVIIRHLLEVSGVKSRRVVSSLAGANNVTIRIVEVPKMSERELNDSMKFEIDRFVPFAHGQQTQKSFKALPVPASTDGNMQVALAVAVDDVVTSHIQALKAAGLDPVAIEVEPQAAARSLTGFTDGGLPLNETVGIINMGYSNTELSVVTGGLLIFPRTITIGGESFTRAIAENFGMRMDAAERLKRQYAQVDLDRLSQSPGSAPVGGGLGDFGDLGFGDLGGSAPPSFDYNGPAAPSAPAAPAAGTPGLNPFLYGGAPGAAGGVPPAPGSAMGSAAPPSQNFDLPGFATPSEEDSAPAGSVFDLGGGEGDDLASLFPGNVTKPPQPPPPAPQPVSPASPQAAGPAAFGGFDLGGEAEPAAADADAPPPAIGGAGGGFDLSAFDTPGGGAAGAPAMAHVTDAPAASSDEDDQTRAQIQDIILPVLGELVTEIRRSLEYYRSHNPNLPISRLFLAGGNARIPNLGRFLENELGLPVSVANPIAGVTVAAAGVPPEWLQEIAPVLTIAMGLGEREMLDVPRDYVPRTLAAAQQAV